MTLWRLGGANVAPLRIVEFSGRNEFARLLYRRTESPQVADTTQERQPIHHLTDARLRSHLSRLEIARGERRFHAHVHNRRLEHLVHIGRIDNILKLARRLTGAVVNLLHDDLLNPDEVAKFISKPVEDDCKPELVVKFNPNTFPDVFDNGADIPVILY